MISKQVALGLAAAFLLAATMASAQGQMEKLAKTTPQERATVQTMTMKEKLSLTAEQLPAIEKINLATATQMQPILEGSEGPLIKMRQAKAIESGRDAELQKILTPAQYQQWLVEKDAMKQKVEQKLMEKHSGGAQ
jgi:hypothetical protein